MPKLDKSAELQRIARSVLNSLDEVIEVGMTERDICEICIQGLESHGVTETWYYDVPAFVLVGDRTIISISGRDYAPDNQLGCREGDIFTVDLSPSHNGFWGDCARTFVLGEPKKEVLEGIEVEHALHRTLRTHVEATMTFEALHSLLNDKIVDFGFENLDFAGNLGHSIATRLTDRIYIERGNKARLGDVAMFTFEPHIRRPNTRMGFKHEEIYHFDANGDLLPI